MKKHNTNSVEVSTKKKLKKSNKEKKRKKRAKSRKRGFFHKTQFALSNNPSNTVAKDNSEVVAQPELFIPHSDVESTLNESDLKIMLTPSKSECDDSYCIISDINESEISCNSLEESFNMSTDNTSFSYNTIIDEFANEDKGEENCTIVSLPIIDRENSEHTDVNLATTSSLPQKEKKKSKMKRVEPDDKTRNDCVIIDEHNSDKTAQYYETDDGVIVILEKDDTIYFHGLMILSVLHGEIETLGYTVTKNSKDVKLYSPRGTSLLYLKNVTTQDIPVKSYLTNLKISNEVKLTDNCAIILCKKLDEANISFIEKHISQQILPRIEDSNMPRVVFQPKGKWNVLKPNHNWDRIISGINKSTKMMICGGKGVGKTTFLRYAINQLLMKFKEIRIIDLDPGQSEFTIPGCISIIRINEPVFGVNYTHLKAAERSILSNINIGYEPEKYIASVKCLLDTSLDEIPTLINYMGYTYGIGINILSAAIVHMQPTDILQIHSQNSKKNYRCKLSVDVVIANAKVFVDLVPTDLNYNLYEVQSMCDYNDGWTAEPRQLREMSILAYISQMADSNSVFRTKSPLYKIVLSAVKICDLKGEIIHPAAVNACLVALCSVEEEVSHIFQCFGFGIIRGVDMASNELVLLTAEKLQTLEKVSHLVLHSASLPPSIYMTPDEVKGQMPYVIEGVLMSFGQIPKRSRIPVNNGT